MLGKCSFLLENGDHCNKTFQLHNLYFRDPYAIITSDLIDLCKWHYDEIVLLFTDRVKQLQMKLSNMISEQARYRKIARDNGVYRSNETQEQRIQDLKELIKRITSTECKNFLCMANLTRLERYSKLYSVHLFKQSGRRQFTFYFCSLKCFNIIRSKCGLHVPILQGQHTL